MAFHSGKEPNATRKLSQIGNKSHNGNNVGLANNTDKIDLYGQNIDDIINNDDIAITTADGASDQEVLAKYKLLEQKYQALQLANNSLSLKYTKLKEFKSQNGQSVLNPTTQPFIPTGHIPTQALSSQSHIQSASTHEITIQSLQSQIDALETQLQTQLETQFTSTTPKSNNTKINPIISNINNPTPIPTIPKKLVLIKAPQAPGDSINDERFNGDSWQTKELYKRCVAANQRDKYTFNGESVHEADTACKFYIHLMNENNELIDQKLFLEDIFVEHIIASMIIGSAKKKLDAKMAIGHKFRTVESILLWVQEEYHIDDYARELYQKIMNYKIAETEDVWVKIVDNVRVLLVTFEAAKDACSAPVREELSFSLQELIDRLFKSLPGKCRNYIKQSLWIKYEDELNKGNPKATIKITSLEQLEMVIKSAHNKKKYFEDEDYKDPTITHFGINNLAKYEPDTGGYDVEEDIEYYNNCSNDGYYEYKIFEDKKAAALKRYEADPNNYWADSSSYECEECGILGHFYFDCKRLNNDRKERMKIGAERRLNNNTRNEFTKENNNNNKQ